MIIISKLNRCLLYAAILALFSGCATTSLTVSHDQDPDQRLGELLVLHEEVRAQGGRCGEIRGAARPTLDCHRIQTEVGRLYAEYPGQDHIVMTNAVLQFEAGRSDNAQFLLDQILGSPGRHPEAAILRTQIALAEGNTVYAVELLENQIALAPDYPELREALAATYYIAGSYFEAQRELNIANRLGAPLWRVAYHSGLVQEAQENWGRACLEYQSALSARADFSPAMSRLIGLSEQSGCTGVSTALSSYRNTR